MPWDGVRGEEREGRAVAPRFAARPPLSGPLLVALAASLAGVTLASIAADRTPPIPPAPIVQPCGDAAAPTVPGDRRDRFKNGRGERIVRRAAPHAMLQDAAQAWPDSVDCDVVVVLTRGDA